MADNRRQIEVVMLFNGGTKKCYWEFNGWDKKVLLGISMGGQKSVTGNLTGWDKKVLLGI